MVGGFGIFRIIPLPYQYGKRRRWAMCLLVNLQFIIWIQILCQYWCVALGNQIMVGMLETFNCLVGEKYRPQMDQTLMEVTGLRWGRTFIHSSAPRGSRSIYWFLYSNLKTTLSSCSYRYKDHKTWQRYIADSYMRACTQHHCDFYCLVRVLL